MTGIMRPAEGGSAMDNDDEGGGRRDVENTLAALRRRLPGEDPDDEEKTLEALKKGKDMVKELYALLDSGAGGPVMN